MAEYSRLKLNCWIVLTAWFIPRRWRSARTQKLLAIAEKGKEKMEKSLDIRSIYKS